MKTAHKLRHVIAISAVAASLAACSALSGRESAGEYVDDTTISTNVRAGLLSDTGFKATQVHVETMQGTVELSGFVDHVGDREKSGPHRMERQRREGRQRPHRGPPAVQQLIQGPGGRPGRPTLSRFVSKSRTDRKSSRPFAMHWWPFAGDSPAARPPRSATRCRPTALRSHPAKGIGGPAVPGAITLGISVVLSAARY